MAGGRHEGQSDRDTRPGTPRGELARISDSRERQAEETRGAILDAMLATCGTKGYRQVAVQDVIERYGGNRVQFYRHFGNKADCYAEAYEREADRLGDRILGAACAAETWRLGLRAGLGELGRYAGEQPLVARGLVVEVHVAGGIALRKRDETCERLASALDVARRDPAAQSPPEISARFMVGAVESSLSAALLAGDPRAFAAATPELAHMIVSTYLGEEAAAEELAAAV